MTQGNQKSIDSFNFFGVFMKISLMIPVHNALDVAMDSIKCALDCRYALKPGDGLDIHIYDDGSDDETREYLAQLKGVWYLRNDEPRGYAHHLNTLALWCVTGHRDVAIVANSDTAWRPESLRRLIEVCRDKAFNFAGPRLSACGSGQGPTPEITRDNLRELEQKHKDDGIRESKSINGAFFAFDPSLCLRHGFFDERFGRGSAEEEEWMRRIVKNTGVWGRYAKDSVVFHHKHASFSKAKDLDSKSLWRENNNKMRDKINNQENFEILTSPREWPVYKQQGA